MFTRHFPGASALPHGCAPPSVLGVSGFVSPLASLLWKVLFLYFISVVGTEATMILQGYFSAVGGGPRMGSPSTR